MEGGTSLMDSKRTSFALSLAGRFYHSDRLRPSVLYTPAWIQTATRDFTSGTGIVRWARDVTRDPPKRTKKPRTQGLLTSSSFIILPSVWSCRHVNLRCEVWLTVSARHSCQRHFAFSEEKVNYSAVPVGYTSSDPSFCCKRKSREWLLFSFFFLFLDAAWYYSSLCSDIWSKIRDIEEETRMRWMWIVELRWRISMAIKLGI